MESIGEGSLAEDSIGMFSPWFRLGESVLRICTPPVVIAQWCGLEFGMQISGQGHHVRKIHWRRQHWHFVVNLGLALCCESGVSSPIAVCCGCVRLLRL